MNPSLAASSIVPKEGKAILTPGYVNGVIRIKNASGEEDLAKSVMALAAGDVYVHLIKDTDGATKTYTLITLVQATEGDFSGQYEAPCIFDEIRQSGTTIALTDLIVWL